MTGVQTCALPILANHGFVQSIYFRDPNGYVIELTSKLPGHDKALDRTLNNARGKLDAWQTAKRESGII